MRFCMVFGEGEEGPRLGGAQPLREGRETGRGPKARPMIQGPRETQEPDDLLLLFGSMLV